MGVVPDHDAELKRLLSRNRPLRAWLRGIHGLVRDGTGATIVVGLNPDETLEFVRLEGLHFGQDRKSPEKLSLEDRQRYSVLSRKIELALPSWFLGGFLSDETPRLIH